MTLRFNELLCSLIALSLLGPGSFLTVASPTRLQLLNVVLPHQLRPQRFLRFSRLVAHLCDELTRADILFGVAMTVEAPLHLQRRILIHQRHLTPEKYVRPREFI